MRQIVLDTETTGLEVSQGHRIIEIGCVELLDREPTGNHFHVYLNPQREVDAGALAVHGLSNEFLADKPLFSDIQGAFLEFVQGSELIIHNAAFDEGFLDFELSLLEGSPRRLREICSITDTLLMARRKHPGQKNNLDALCKRYQIDNSHRELHGALLDARILADVYIRMTGGQTSLVLQGDEEDQEEAGISEHSLISSRRPPLRVIRALPEELAEHEKRLDSLQKAAGSVVWRARAPQ